jgi:hypothetical protein
MSGRSDETPAVTVRLRYKGVPRDFQLRCADCPRFECLEPVRHFILRTREELFTCDVRAQHGCPSQPEKVHRPRFVLDYGGVWVRAPRPTLYERPETEPQRIA